MKHNIAIIFLLVIFFLTACNGNHLQLKTSGCEKPGTIQSDRIPHPTQGFDTSFQVYLPPCYADLKDVHFPVLYLVAVAFESQLSPTSNDPMALADRLIHAGKMPPALVIVPEETIAQGYHASLAIDLVPYVDEKYNTLRDRQYRGVGGISHGAAIAARMAFQFPDLFGSLGMLSGGIAAGETSTFDTWIDSSQNRPRVLIDVGDQDAIMNLTKNLLGVMDAHKVPYELNVDPGNHTGQFWSDHMESYLLWFAEGWN
jgi:enterochelin esterase-like enzyme